jgi:hypothetical protein
MTTGVASTDARHELSVLLRANGIDAYPYPPETLSLPCVVVYPSDPYLEPNRLGHDTLRAAGFFTLAVAVQALDNEAGLSACEALIEDTLMALPSGVQVTRVSRPGLDDTGAQGSVYVSEITITAQLERTP